MYPKPKPEDEAIKKLKELGLRPANKRCFDCGQRGPTYINVTIGSFVCSSCGGLLRGITPSQRIKSVSMASFTPAEIQMIEQRGNEVCASVWLGKWSKPDPPTFDKNSDTGRRDFLCDKYEKKLWYVDPSQAVPRAESGDAAGKSLKQIAAKQSPSPISVARSRGASVTSLKTPPTVKAPPPAPTQGMVRSASLPSQSLQRQQTQQSPHLVHNRQPLTAPPQSAPNFAQPQNPPPLPPKASDMQQNFANFDAFGLPNTPATSGLASTPQNHAPVSTLLTPNYPVSGVLQPMSSTPLQPSLTPAASLSQPPLNDRYAALADLDSTLRSLSMTMEHKPSEPVEPVNQTTVPHSSHNPFLQGGWSGTPLQGQGGVSMVNTSSILSTGTGQGTPSSQFGSFPATDFPAANSVGQPMFYGQNQSQFNMQASHLSNTSQQQHQFVPAHSNPFHQPFVSQTPNSSQQPFVSQQNHFSAQHQQQFVAQSQQHAFQQPNQFAGQGAGFGVPQQQFMTQQKQVHPQSNAMFTNQPMMNPQQQRFLGQQHGIPAHVASNPTNPFS